MQCISALDDRCIYAMMGMMDSADIDYISAPVSARKRLSGWLVGGDAIQAVFDEGFANGQRNHCDFDRYGPVARASQTFHRPTRTYTIKLYVSTIHTSGSIAEGCWNWMLSSEMQIVYLHNLETIVRWILFYVLVNCFG